MKWKIIFFIAIIIVIATAYFLPRYTKYHIPVTIKPSAQQLKIENIKVTKAAKNLKQFCSKNNYNTQFVFIVDMSQHSRKNRFFVYDFIKDTIVNAGLVAHGSCNNYYLEKAQFNDIIGCGCSSLGKYKISYSYNGRFGKAFKLVGLDTTNSNAFERSVVLHAYNCVPNSETYPQPICNSLGCPMVSYQYLENLSKYILSSSKPVILQILN